MNNNNSILLIDPAFDPATAPACSLLVKIGLDSFSYAIIDKKTKHVNAVFDEQECENGAQRLIERLKTDSYLTLPYQEVKVAIHTQNAISIPNDIYDEEALAAHSQYLTAMHSGNLYVQHQDYFGFTTIFTLPKSVDDVLGNGFAKWKKYQQHAGLLSLATHLNETALFLDFTIGSFNVLYIKNRQVIFQQYYEIENIEEFNYYLLLMINQLSIDTKETNLHLGGPIHEGDEKYNCLLKYFTSIQFITIDNVLDQQILDDMPIHYYSSLLALDQCV